MLFELHVGQSYNSSIMLGDCDANNNIDLVGNLYHLQIQFVKNSKLKRNVNLYLWQIHLLPGGHMV